MARPKAKELTERELEIMHVFWEQSEATVAEIREQLARRGRDLAYTTVATLVKILDEKGFLEQVTFERPFQFRAARSFDDVSLRLVTDLVERVFGGSRERLLLRLFEQRKLNKREKQLLQQILDEEEGKKR